MHSRITPNQPDYERIYQRCWQDMLEVLLENNAISIIAAKRYFKLGTKRAQEFISYVDEVKKEFEAHQADGVLHKKIDEELLEVGIDTSEMWTEQDSLIEQANNMRKRAKNVDYTIHEARDIKAKLDGFRKVVK